MRKAPQVQGIIIQVVLLVAVRDAHGTGKKCGFVYAQDSSSLTFQTSFSRHYGEVVN